MDTIPSHSIIFSVIIALSGVILYIYNTKSSWKPKEHYNKKTLTLFIINTSRKHALNLIQLSRPIYVRGCGVSTNITKGDFLFIGYKAIIRSNLLRLSFHEFNNINYLLHITSNSSFQIYGSSPSPNKLTIPSNVMEVIFDMYDDISAKYLINNRKILKNIDKILKNGGEHHKHMKYSSYILFPFYDKQHHIKYDVINEYEPYIYPSYQSISKINDTKK